MTKMTTRLNWFRAAGALRWAATGICLVGTACGGEVTGKGEAEEFASSAATIEIGLSKTSDGQAVTTRTLPISRANDFVELARRALDGSANVSIVNTRIVRFTVKVGPEIRVDQEAAFPAATSDADLPLFLAALADRLVTRSAEPSSRPANEAEAVSSQLANDCSVWLSEESFRAYGDRGACYRYCICEMNSLGGPIWCAIAC